jgi:DNA-binding PadR family transcriptional regulator
MELDQRVKIAGYASVTIKGLHGLLHRFTSKGLLNRTKTDSKVRYSLTEAGRQYLEATKIQLPLSTVRMLSLLTLEPQQSSALVRQYVAQFDVEPSFAYWCLKQLSIYGLAERRGEHRAFTDQLTPLGEMTQMELLGMSVYLGLPEPLPDEKGKGSASRWQQWAQHHDALLALISVHGQLSTQALAEQLKIPEVEVGSALYELERLGRIEKRRVWGIKS